MQQDATPEVVLEPGWQEVRCPRRDPQNSEEARDGFEANSSKDKMGAGMVVTTTVSTDSRSHPARPQTWRDHPLDWTRHRLPAESAAGGHLASGSAQLAAPVQRDGKGKSRALPTQATTQPSNIKLWTDSSLQDPSGRPQRRARSAAAAPRPSPQQPRAACRCVRCPISSM